MKAARVVENVRSLNKQNVDFVFKIIVTDNSCNDKNAATLRVLEQEFQNVTVNINKENIGYPKAHNVFNDSIEGDYVLIVNPDIVWSDESALGKMVKYIDKHTEVGILGPKQFNETGGITMSVRAFPRFFLQVSRRTFLRHMPLLKSLVSHDEMRHLDYNQIQEVDWLQSSCIIIRKQLWREVGGFSEDYFLFVTDVEICWEAWKRGYKVLYYPEAIVYADGRRVSAGGFLKFFRSSALRQHVIDSLKYRFKYFGKRNPRLKISR